ncbi:transposase [Acetobacter fabarum]|uniref:integrase core domain-containing protein n=1 Tax=Acetobacter fabarum TaxID=483199 RepID=UPI001404C13A|nr:transposase [Acetobacter fabarum]
MTWCYTKPSNPQQNAYIECYNRNLRQELLEQYLFESIQNLQEAATKWLWTYNYDRISMGGYRDMPSLSLFLSGTG